MADKSIAEKVLDYINKPVVVEATIPASRITIKLMSNNTFMFSIDGINYHWCYSKAILKDGSFIYTKDAKRISYTISAEDNGYKATVIYRKNDLTLTQVFLIEDNQPFFKMYITVTSTKGKIATNQLIPMEFAYPSSQCHSLFSTPEVKMVLVPYDNDMWVHYESAYLAPNRTSYEVTAIYDEDSLDGIIIGALDFDFWKNAIVCSSNDARVFSAISGIADSGTHDQLPHGYQNGIELKSSTFMVGRYSDIRNGFEQYADLAKNPDRFIWNKGTIFGWNSYSALAAGTTLEHYSEAARFIKEELPEFHNEDGITYINLDATFGLDKGKLKKIIKKLHQNGQKAGTYLAPLCHMEFMNMIPLKGSFLKFRKDIVLKKPDGSNYDQIDSKLPVDITIPEAETSLRLQLREIVDMGFDYLKIDFLSHGALEGTRYNKDIKTGRQALLYFYNILKEELADKDIFISLSIAPLFPCGYGMARRSCCDSFGHGEDIKYVLNALNYGWWVNNTLYYYNDPDHTVLYQSAVDGRKQSSTCEARSRYNASIISGGIMLLSDNYGTSKEERIQEKERTIQFANNAELNQLVQKHETFKPCSLAPNSNIFYLQQEDGFYLAVFNLYNKVKTYTIVLEDIGGPITGKAYNLNTNKTYNYDRKITIQLDSYDSVILLLK